MLKRCSHRMVRKRFDETLGCVVRTAALAITTGHQRFESLAEYLRVDRCLRPTGGVFAAAEAIMRQQIRERIAKGLVGENAGAVPLLDCRTRKQSTVEEWN